MNQSTDEPKSETKNTKLIWYSHKKSFNKLLIKLVNGFYPQKNYQLRFKIHLKR